MPVFDAMISKKDAARLRVLDRELMAEFVRVYPQAKRPTKWQNRQIQSLVKRRGLGADATEHLFSLLERKGTFDVRIERHTWVDSDKHRYVHSVARATMTDMWPMGTHYWVRDNSIIGARFLNSSSARRRKVGKELLLSAMNFMSSCAQLKRFERMIRSTSPSFLKDSSHWPYIFAAIKDNLACDKSQGWTHKQDAWQILAWYVLEGLESGSITLQELSAKNCRFLGLIIPFLAKASFWKCENSGSWEEIPAVRSSVRMWDHRLVVRLGELSNRKGFAFLRAEFLRSRKYLPARWRGYDVEKMVSVLDREATKAMLRDLPREAPGYTREDARFRDADAALLYLLELGYPEFLADRAGKSRQWAYELEQAIVHQVLSLQDSRSGAISRYANDTYQRSGFFRNLTVLRLTKLYGAPSADASSRFAEREYAVPRGRKAAWTHFVWQIASWAAKRYEETGRADYSKLHDRFFVQGLQLVTQHSKSLDVDKHGRARIISIPAWRMPECYIADKANTGEELVFPSPHTPLNWAIAEMLRAFEARRRFLAGRFLATRSGRSRRAA
jgi:hypothetical protein